MQVLKMLIYFMMILEIGKEYGDDAEQRHIGTEVIDRLDAIAVGEVAEHGRCHATDTKGKSEKQARDHAELCRQKFLSVKQNSRESRRQYEAGTEAHNRRQR